jgi:hypothetical protein
LKAANKTVMAKFKAIAAGVVALILVPLLWPRQRVVAPAWTIVVVREGRPVAGAVVRERWQDYSVESDSHLEDRGTDASGRVVFPRRVVFASPLHRFAGCFANVATTGVHASCGPFFSATASSGGFEGWVWGVRGQRPEETIALNYER